MCVSRQVRPGRSGRGPGAVVSTRAVSGAAPGGVADSAALPGLFFGRGGVIGWWTALPLRSDLFPRITDGRTFQRSAARGGGIHGGRSGIIGATRRGIP